MLEWMRKATLAGLGILTLKEEKIREIVNELIEQGELSKEEGTEFIGELRERLEKSKAELEGKLGELLRRALDKMNLPTREQVDRLAQTQQELLSRIERLERGGEVGEERPGSG